MPFPSKTTYPSPSLYPGLFLSQGEGRPTFLAFAPVETSLGLAEGASLVIHMPSGGTQLNPDSTDIALEANKTVVTLDG